MGSTVIAVLFLQPRCWMEVGGHLQTPAPLPLGTRPCTHCTGGWAANRAGLDMENLPHPNGCRSPDRPASTVVDPGTHSHVIATISWGVSSSSVGHARSSSDLVRNFFLNKVIYETWRWSLILLFQVQNYSWITKNFEHYCFKFVGAEFKSTMICQSEM